MVKKTKNELQRKRVQTGALSLASVAAGAAALWFSVAAYPDIYRATSDVDTNFTLQNIGVALIALQLFLALLLKKSQAGAYWFFWLQLTKTELDERQRAVRQQVMEKAYGFALVVLTIVAVYLTGSVAEFGQEARYDITMRLIWVAGIFLISLPSILASWRRDS